MGFKLTAIESLVIQIERFQSSRSMSNYMIVQECKVKFILIIFVIQKQNNIKELK
jgi:hypothetical protein